MLLYSNTHYAVYFVNNATFGKEGLDKPHDIKEQFAIVNNHLGTVEAYSPNTPQALHYADMLASEWEARIEKAIGRFNTEIQGFAPKEAAAPKAELKLATVDGESVE